MTNSKEDCESIKEIKLNDDEIILSKNQILKNVYQKCKKEAENEELEIPLTRVPERVANYMGIPVDIVNNVYKNDNHIYQISSINLSGRIAIYKCLKDLYLCNTPPTYDNVYEVVKQFVNILTLEEFIDYMILLGYDYYYTTSGIKMLMEDPKITFERFFYLNKIAEIRGKNVQTIYYIEERVIDLRLKFNKMWLDDVIDTTNPWNGYILLHITTGKKFIESLYCNHVTEDDFMKWMSDIVLKNLNPNSVIVMDNNKLHGTLHHKTLTKYNSKADMLSWLQDNNIPCSNKMRKAELYQLYKKCPKNKQNNNIDRLLKVHGHDVLRLPSTLHDLSPTEQLWDHIRSIITSDEEITSNLLNYELPKLKLKVEMLTFNSNIIDKLSQYENETTQIEKEIHSLDAGIENVIDDFYILK